MPRCITPGWKNIHVNFRYIRDFFTRKILFFHRSNRFFKGQTFVLDKNVKNKSQCMFLIRCRSNDESSF